MRKIYAIILLFLSSLLATSAKAYDFYADCATGQTLCYTITSDTLPYTVKVVRSIFSVSGDIEIPESVESNSIEYSVTAVGDSAFFYDSDVTSVIIPNTVTVIGSYAFHGCELLQSVTFPNSLTAIGDYAISYCYALGPSITIPENVTSIGRSAFIYCRELTTVNFNATNCTNIGSSSYYAFGNCSAFSTLNIGDNVINIPAYAFYNCHSLSTVAIPSTVQTIGTDAFKYVRNIVYGGSAEGSPWGALTVNGYVEGTLVYSDNTKTKITGCIATATSVEIPSSVTEIGERAFYNCTGLSEISLPNTVTRVGDYAFMGSCNVPVYNDTWFAYFPKNYATEYTIPEGIQHIAGGAFYAYNSGLAAVTIPNTVTTIGKEAFYYNASLTSITIPESVVSIGERAFYYCNNLTTVNFYAINCTAEGLSTTMSLFGDAVTSLTIGERVTRIPDYAFIDCTGLTGPLVIPDSVTYIGEEAFAWCSGITEITIGKSVDDVGAWAFSGCSSMTTFNYNAENCTSFSPGNYWAFNSCSSFTTLNIGENVKSIPPRAFQLCNFTEVTIPDSVTYIGEEAFMNCRQLATVNYNAINCTVEGISSTRPLFGSALTSLTIGEKVKTIPSYAFANCSGLTGTLILPDSLESIGYGAFSGCSGFTGTLTIPESVTSFASAVFSGCSGLTSIVFNATNCTEMSSCFTDCTSITSLTIGENVTRIPDHSFRQLGLTGTLTFPESVTSIGEWAFYDCNELTEVVIGNSVTTIGDYAFFSCSGLTSVTISNSVSSIGRDTFYSCGNLTTVNYNATNCTSMGDYGSYIFSSCTSLTTIHIAENVTRIPEYAFYDCGSITDIYMYSSTPPTIVNSTYSFASATYSNATVWTPCPAAAVYRNTSSWNRFSNIRNEQTSTYNIAVQTADANMGDVAGDGSFTCDTEVALTATPNDGYRFLSWNDGNEDNPRTIVVGGDSTFVASFRAIHTITASASVGGTISPSGEITVDEDADQSFTIAPANCYRLASVLVDGVEAIDELVGGVYTFTGVTTDHTIEAIFEMLTYTISVTASEHGTVTHEGNDGDAVVNCGSSQSFTITPETYYRILSVIVDGQDVTSQLVDGVYSFANVTADHTIAVTFEIITYTIDASANNDEFGSVSGGGTYDAGTEISLTATPNDGYRFVSWNDANTDNPRTLIVTSDSTFVATFVRSQFAITAISSDPDGGSVMGGGTYSEGDTATLTATPSIGYCFISWSDGNTDNPRMVEVVQDSTFVAEFSAIVHRAVDTTVTSYLSADEHTFYVSGVYSYIIPSDIGCDTIVDLTLQVLDEPKVFEISPNPAKSLINISSEDYISMVEIYSTAGRLVIQKQIDANMAEVNIEWLVPGVYFVRLFCEEGGQPVVQKFIKE